MGESTTICFPGIQRDVIVRLSLVDLENARFHYSVSE